mmetsp:Transcript_35241/g.78427  ORF Transcript_35241/g.78427 Transcript_35241/m.78427 type:complete len:304 (-) Transcript_35241:829-1740(-)
MPSVCWSSSLLLMTGAPRVTSPALNMASQRRYSCMGTMAPVVSRYCAALSAIITTCQAISSHICACFLALASAWACCAARQASISSLASVSYCSLSERCSSSSRLSVSSQSFSRRSWYCCSLSTRFSRITSFSCRSCHNRPASRCSSLLCRASAATSASACALRSVRAAASCCSTTMRLLLASRSFLVARSSPRWAFTPAMYAAVPSSICAGLVAKVRMWFMCSIGLVVAPTAPGGGGTYWSSPLSPLTRRFMLISNASMPCATSRLAWLSSSSFLRWLFSLSASSTRSSSRSISSLRLRIAA